MPDQPAGFQTADSRLTEAFYRLTPEAVLDSLAELGHAPSGRFIILNSYENRVYQMELEDGGWVVGKFYRPGRWSDDTILDEHRFLSELSAAEIPVAAPLLLSSGSTLSRVAGIRFALFPRIGGRSPQELNDDELRMVGRLIARIHNVGAAGDAPHRMRLSPLTYGENNLRYLLENGIIPDEARANYEATVEALLARIVPMFEGVPCHRIHGDCHLANLIHTPKGTTFLDFDDMLVGPAVQDIWMPVASADEYGQRQRDVLIEGYEEFRSFEPYWLRLVEPLRALRFIHYSTWIARRFSDPAFARTFTYFGTVQYWQNETNDLREQIARIDTAVPY